MWVQKKSVVHLCCMEHLRRKFVEAQKAEPKKANSGRTSKADVAVSYIAKLYAVEKANKDNDSAECFEVRQEKSKLILEKIKQWMDNSLPKVLPKSKLGEA